MTLDALRQQFPHTQEQIYVNHAATSPLSRPVKAAMGAHLQEQGITAALRNRMLRFAPTYYNTPEEIDAVLEAVAAFEEEKVAQSGCEEKS